MLGVAKLGEGVVAPADHTSKLMCYVINNLLPFVMHCTCDSFDVLYIDFTYAVG